MIVVARGEFILVRVEAVLFGLTMLDCLQSLGMSLEPVRYDLKVPF